MTDQKQQPDQTAKPDVQATGKTEGREATVVAGVDPVDGGLDAQTATASGLTEGEVKALRDEAGVNGLAGSEPNIHAWAATEDGQKFADEEDDRNKEAEDGVESAHEDLDDDGVSEASKEYQEVAESTSSGGSKSDRTAKATRTKK